jgi:hypothetical protein
MEVPFFKGQFEKAVEKCCWPVVVYIDLKTGSLPVKPVELAGM